MKRRYKKSWTHFFQAIKGGRKLHDVREDDGYQIGDILVLQEFDNINGRYTGAEIEVEVTYITNRTVPCAFSSAVLSPGHCILSLKVLA
ncbi:DUF3850 domain-containing protein [Bradyrhizobium ottawaense]|uniref:DUF3850 domain-containing protein n=1 Tax=Bradyrhizobium ottawaense TaxID=931866 RepID=A0ABY0QHM7_9BRAD|nr:DUF3850 domain-containing protein [Bradyrhizobium ottawaense]SDK38856.1 protein of unknown function [Bradyrhizobium ottawaense]SDK46857.1 protein of unknown function [Bradyrhizobium ottawaense]